MVVVVVEEERSDGLMTPKSRIPFLSFRMPFRPRESWNHSGGIQIPFYIPPEWFYQFGRPLCQN
jgi:hypothetical protein